MAIHHIEICCAGKCGKRGAEDLFHALKDQLDPDFAEVGRTGCLTACGSPPNALIDGVLYKNLTVDAVLDLLNRPTEPA